MFRHFVVTTIHEVPARFRSKWPLTEKKPSLVPDERLYPALSWSLSDPEWGWMTKQKFNINFCKLCGTFLDFEPSIFTATLFVQLYWELLLRKLLRYCWFSHDVTKIQTKKLSILPWFYFHDALEHCWKLIFIQIFASKGFLFLW